MVKQTDFNAVLSAVEAAALNDVVNLTSDRVEALAGGHGMVNMALFSVADVIVEELQKGQSLEVKFANARKLPVDDIMKKAIDAAKASGADGANAALIVASMMYLAGSAAQVGVPAGNRKLGATARMLAGVDRSGVSAIPTTKMNSKVSAFPAVAAIYEAIRKGELSPVDGRDIPPFVGGAIYGHSALGEDYIWPALVKKGAQIGTQAMLDSMAGIGIGGSKFQAAILGAAAILEIIHPDAEVPEECGTYGRTSSVYLVGKLAAETAGLPEKLHMRITGEEYDTAHVVGDIGLILKDIGGPSVIGMMAMAEVLACFEERISGGSGGAHNPPLGHMTGYTMCAIKALQAGMKPDEIGRAIVADRCSDVVNPYPAPFCIYVVAKKASELHNGPVTKLLVEVTLPYVTKLIHDKALTTYEGLNAGKTLAEIVKQMDDERVADAEKYGAKYWKKIANRDVTVKYLKIANAARRTSKSCQKYLAFDPLITVEVTEGDRHVVLEHYTDQVIPAVCLKKDTENAWTVEIAAPITSELVLSGCMILNVVIPAAVAALMGYGPIEDTSAEAEAAAYITAGIPGPKMAARRLGRLAQKNYDVLTQPWVV
ncbi:MAG: hypothetical protein LUE31_11875 [Lachnospiraceae bacterium]|nr:hypothetical protein [Lachnospiraceae bacterium]